MDNAWKTIKFIFFFSLYLFLLGLVLETNFFVDIEKIALKIDLSRLLKTIFHF